MHGFEKTTIIAGFFAAVLAAMPLLSVYAQGQIVIDGAGATFPFPLIDTWRVQYQKVDPSISLNYQSIGSGGGVKQFTERTVDFGASDAPLTESERSALPGPAVHIPETIGSVVAAYNVPGVEKGLKLTGPVLADIYLGKIKKWNDPAIASENQGVNLPDRDIVVVRRADGSGTTFVWTSYLATVSPEWKDQVGAGKSVEWPAGVGAPGNEGVSNTIGQTPYSLGYVELSYVLTTGMDYASIKNKAGNFVEPTLASTKAAVEAAATSLPAGDASWANVSLLDAPGDDSYPIASFSYLLLYKEMSTTPKVNSMQKAQAIVDFIAWAISPEGQKHAEELSYVPLPDNVVQANMQTLASLTYNGQPVMQQQSGQQSSTVSATFEGKSYPVKVSSATAKVTNIAINAGQSIDVGFDKPGDVELTLPKAMIDGIQVVSAGGQEVSFQQVGSTATDTTIKFTVPDGSTGPVSIKGASVVPEFGVVAALVLAASLVAVIGVARFKGQAFGLGRL
ncbi:phosphate ABC transporter substrate-binding protein PstS [Nitrososphaera viennensis]|mgnify:CR=1 FL=1|uniref:ABC phosphate uptake transporter, substrate-binding protein n=2 Tax=Nitrososphaera viennensis TaxID=1034015 RepID=A0A060HT77_9ARCH|nr:phosphate ABC transporter substrate-binding protein PstS [Nitrososphaera viennensis]AIC16347.1 ABC phosphate uptake transporter, substrate-binding protein [Nitrososphaera viennensis EN76]UVS68283.1 phosphate ABC transporter substrate-binding protein PstS [Nitrososphaera viennensis]